MENTESQQATGAHPAATAPENIQPPSKPIHTLIIDTGPLIKNDPPVSTLLAQAEELYTLPSVLPEIRDAATRARVETQLLPFLKLRSPRPESVKFVTDFARRTGDLEVLSRPDLHLIALAYELECERNGGDWRLRNMPGQKRLNGKSPAQEAKESYKANPEDQEQDADHPTDETAAAEIETPTDAAPVSDPEIAQQLDTLTLNDGKYNAEETKQSESASTPAEAEQTTEEDPDEDDEDDDEEGWITPSNLKQRQQRDQQSAPEQPIQKVLQVALLTSDYAMQNVLLRINLNLVSPSLARITRIKTWVLRCHGCFQITRNMGKQFCPKCGQNTLTRVSCSTDQSGNFQVYLKKNYQWNNRGNVYSVPKPVHGTSNGKYRGQGGGRNGWGRELLLTEDQKEYTQKVSEERKLRQRDLMDEDYLPGILSGHRQGGAGKIRVGAGRNVNSRKRN